jgi:LPS-assembly protein
VKGVPVFYFPYFSAPLEDMPRSSGLLLPRTSTSTTKGRSISESYYYAINRSADVTLTGEYFSKRGMAGAVTFRAVPDANSNVEVNSFFAPDRLGEGGHITNILGHTTRGSLRAVADLNVISSLTFRQVFGEGFDLISSPRETSKAFATYNTPIANLNFLYSRQGTFFVNQPSTIVRKLPSFDMGVYSHPLGPLPLYLSFDGSVAGVHRRDGAIRTPAFVERIDIRPRIEFPLLRGPAFSWTHTAGVRNTHYSHRRGGGAKSDARNRFAFEYSFQFTGPRLERRYGSHWKHVVEPYVDYRYVSGVDRFSDTLQIDEIDLFANTNEVRYGIVNRLFRDREILSWSLSQKYFSDPTFGAALVPGRDNVLEPLLDLTGFGFGDNARRFSPLVSRLSYAPTAGTNADLQLDYDTLRSEFKSIGLIGRQQAGAAFYSIAYFYTRESAIQLRSNQVRGTVGWGNNTRPGFNAAFSFAYNVDREFFQTTAAQLSYNTDCYGLHLEFMQFDVGARRESRFRFSFTLDDLGSIGTLRRQDFLF